MITRTLVVFFLLVMVSGCAASHKKPQAKRAEAPKTPVYHTGTTRSFNYGNVLSDDRQEMPQDELPSGGKKETATLRLSPKQIQAALKKAGYYKGQIDGKIGPNTKEAIKSFQRSKGLKADGIVGQKTAEKLASYVN